MKCRVKYFWFTVMMVVFISVSAHAQVDFGSQAAVAFENLAQVAPDEQHVAYVTADDLGMTNSTIWVAKPDDSERIAVATGGAGFWVTNPVWSPDSRQIAYLKVLDAMEDEFSIFPEFELWLVNADGTNNQRLTDSPLLNPSLGHGGEADIIWNDQGDILFYDNAAYPMAQYALHVASGEIRKVGETTGGLGEAFVGGQPSNVPYFNQCDSRWKYNRLGTCSHTICSAGCAMSSVAMILKYYGAGVDPGRLNSWLTSRGGYASGCLIYWATAANYHSGTNYVTYIRSRDWNRLRAELNAGYPVIVNVKNGGHWVVVTHYSGGTYYINDPGYSSRKTLASYGNTFSRMVIYHGRRPSPNPTPTPTPKITGVSPNPMRPLPVTQRQPITITGSGFVSGAKLLFKITDSPGYSYPNRVPASLSSSKIVYNISVGPHTHNWTVQVINPDGKASNAYSFRVEPKSAPPTPPPTPVPNPIHKTITLISNAGTPVIETGRGAYEVGYVPNNQWVRWNRELIDNPSGTKWIWSSQNVTYEESFSGATRTFQETFFIPQGAKNLKGSIKIAADDYYTLNLNGRQIASGSGFVDLDTHTFTPGTGNNTLKIAVRNATFPHENILDNPAGVIYRAYITYDEVKSLTVNKSGSGAGSVTGSGISCGNDCTENYTPGTQVILSAAPSAESLFSGWQGACSGTGTCMLTMSADKTVTAVFTRKPLTISASAAPGGRISPSGSVNVPYGTNAAFTFTPDAGYKVSRAIVDGKVVSGVSHYTFSNVKTDHTIRVYFEKQTYTITATAGTGGQITPAGSNTVTHGASQSFTITPDHGYQIADVNVDGVSIGAQAVYTFTHVTANHTIEATFKAVPVVELTLNDAEAKPGAAKVPVTIALNNPTAPVSSLQVHVTYDAGAGIHAVGGAAGYALTERTQGFAATVSVVENGANSEAVILLYSLSGGAIPSGTGAILDLFFTVDIAANPGDKSVLSMSQAILADAGARPIAAAYSDTGTITILNPCDAGDINCDGSVDVLDVQLVLNCISNNGSCERCDLNADGQYNVIDVQILVNIINTVPATTALQHVGEKPGLFGNLEVHLPTLQLQPGTTGSFALELTNDEPVAAGQFEFTYDATIGIDVTGVQLTSRTAGYADPVLFLKDDSDPQHVKVFVLFFSLSGAVIEPGTGAILDFSYQTASDASGVFEPVLLDNLLTDPDGNAQTSPSWGIPDAPSQPQESYLLTVTHSGSGSGTVSSQPDGILCGDDCAATYPAGAEILLAATPDPGSVFIGWAGTCLGSDDCVITVDANHTIEAIFDVLESHYTITASAGDGGAIMPSGEVSVARGASQTFSVVPESGYEVKEVKIDGVSYGALESYTFDEVFVAHRIEVSFRSTTLNYTSFFNFDDQSNIWRDADKSQENPDDDWMCWAAAAANILDWAGWGTDLYNTAQDIFANFQDSWTNAGGLMQYAWNWWFDSTVPPSQAGWSQLNQGGWSSSGSGGGYQSQYNFFEYFHEDWAAFDQETSLWTNGSGLMDTIDQYIQQGFGTTLAVYNGMSGHALSVWGYEYDEYGDYTGVWVSDSDDYASDLKLLSVALDSDTNLWYLDQSNYYGYNGWFIGGVQALDHKPVPEPGTLILIALGLLGLRMLVRNRIKNKK